MPPKRARGGAAAKKANVKPEANLIDAAVVKRLGRKLSCLAPNDDDPEDVEEAEKAELSGPEKEVAEARKWLTDIEDKPYDLLLGRHLKKNHKIKVKCKYPPSDPRELCFDITFRPKGVVVSSDDELLTNFEVVAKDWIKENPKRTVLDILQFFLTTANQHLAIIEGKSPTAVEPVKKSLKMSKDDEESKEDANMTPKKEWWEDDEADVAQKKEAAQPAVNWDEIGDEVNWGDEDIDMGGQPEDDAGEGWDDAVQVDDLIAAGPSLSRGPSMVRGGSEVKSAEPTGAGPLNPARKTRGYRVMAKTDVRKLMQTVVDKVASKLSITPGAASVLLRKNKWNEKLTLQAFETDSKEQCKKYGVVTTLKTVVSVPDPSSSEMFDCPVCFDNVSVSSSFSMPCGHRLCLDCYKQHLASSVTGGAADGGSCLDTHCPGEKCKETVLPEVFEMLLDTAMYSKFEQALLRSYVDDNDQLTWCPGTDCANVIVITEDRATVPATVICGCNTRFCFFCRGEAHAPCTCKEYSDWRSRDKGSDSLDTKFLMEKTKPCPKCGVRTNKDGGCMYVVCAVCKNPWCWQCGKGDHHVWECDRPDFGKTSQQGDLNKYLFFYERFYNHGESEKIAVKQLEEISKRMLSLVETGATWQRVEFLKRSCELVIECRHVIKWTYAKDFYWGDDEKVKAQAQLFRYRQKDLEEYTERLNKLTDECSKAKLSEGSMEELEKSRLQALDWIRALNTFLESFVYAPLSSSS